MKTKIIVEIETDKIKPYIEDGEDFSKEMEKEWHDQIFKKIENTIHDDDFENLLLEDWCDDGEYLNPTVKVFSDIGTLQIRIIQEGAKE